MAKYIVVDERRCLACKQCMLSCALAHSDADSVFEAATGDQRPTPRLHIEAAGDVPVPVYCLHCDDAPCMDSCRVDAITRADADAPVLIVDDECIGCRLCVKACPYGAVVMTFPDGSKKGKAVKCDLCVERTSAGLEPACVEACPTEAISYRALDDEARARQREAAEGLTASISTGPSHEKTQPDKRTDDE